VIIAVGVLSPFASEPSARGDAAVGRILLVTDGGSGPSSIHPDGSGEQQLVGPMSQRIQYPQWSPDGTHIAFVTGNRDLYVVNGDGTSLRRVVSGGHLSCCTDWSPDGRRIAFIKGDGIHADELYVASIDGAAHRLFKKAPWPAVKASMQEDSNVEEVRWSPDGSKIAFIRTAEDTNVHTGDSVRRFEIWIAKPDGTGARRIAAEVENYAKKNVLVVFQGLDWSANSRWLGYIRMGADTSDIYLIHPDGSAKTLMTPLHDASGLGVVRFAPVGTGFAYFADLPWETKDSPLQGFATQLVVHSSVASPRERIDDLTIAEHLGYFTWSPDATRIAFIRDTREDVPSENGIYVKTLGVQGLTQITTGDAEPADWTAH
jgi:Tol biopolymer transport system component